MTSTAVCVCTVSPLGHNVMHTGVYPSGERRSSGRAAFLVESVQEPRAGHRGHRQVVALGDLLDCGELFLREADVEHPTRLVRAADDRAVRVRLAGVGLRFQSPGVLARGASLVRIKVLRHRHPPSGRSRDPGRWPARRSCGLGNLIAAPLQGRARRRGATVFLDLATMEPHEDQWTYLSSLGRLTPKEVNRLAQRLGQVAVGAEVNRLRAPTSTKITVQPPAVVHARLGARITVEAAALPPALLATLKHAASMPNPVFYERQRRRASTWDTPR